MQLLSALAILGLATTASASCKGAQLRAVMTCYKTWMEAYGMTLPSPYTLPQYGDFHAVRMSWFTGQGSTNQQKVCDLGNALITCLQPHWSCIDNEMYQRMGQNKLYAYTYHNDLYVTQFQCSEYGLSLLLPSFDCVHRELANGGVDKQGVCADSIDRFIEQAGSRCGGLKLFLDCMHDAYYDTCGHEGAAFTCESDRAALLAQVQWCGTSPAAEVLLCPRTQRARPPSQAQKLQLQQNGAAAALTSSSGRRATSIAAAILLLVLLAIAG